MSKQVGTKIADSSLVRCQWRVSSKMVQRVSYKKENNKQKKG